jgi:tRNA (cmo5U34)-methyltransferase
MSERDVIFRGLAPAPGEFRFDEAVARVLPDMLRRSIPGYASLLELIGVVASTVVPHDGLVYDLGCSHGAVSLSVRHALGSRQARIVAIDNSPAMVERARALFDGDGSPLPVLVDCADVRDVEFAPCSLVVMNFTLQFVPPDERSAVLRRIYDALLPGGALILSEKTADTTEGPLSFTGLHDCFREANGYSRLEMARKRLALENVLLPDSVATHQGRLAELGFRSHLWFRALQFVSFLAEKPLNPAP